MDFEDAPSASLASALADIAKMTDASESDPVKMLDLLIDIRDRVEQAMNEYSTAVIAAQKLGLAALRASAA